MEPPRSGMLAIMKPWPAATQRLEWPSSCLSSALTIYSWLSRPGAAADITPSGHLRRNNRRVVFKNKIIYDPVLASSSKSCARCGNRFATYGREYICTACRERKPKVVVRMPSRHQLTSRQQQIVELICQAKTNKEIAYELCLTEGTVKEYLHNIFRKLKVTNRTELALRSHAQTSFKWTHH